MAWSMAIVLAMALLAALLSPALSTPPFISMPTGTADRSPAVSLADGLTLDYHAVSCPDLRNMVRLAVQEALEEDIAIAAGLLRIFFHDCFPQGCDASLLLAGVRESEQRLRPNWRLNLRALQLIEDLRGKVHAACGATVSCADITALATHDAVVASGGQPYYVPLGRLDSFGPASLSSVNDLPPPTFTVDQLIGAFSSRNLDETDLVALSGAHTVGRAHCKNLANRFSEDSDFVRRMRDNCTSDLSRLQDLDVTTPDVFDNKYFSNLVEGTGVFTSDQVLAGDNRTRWLVEGFAGDEWWFWNQFGTSMSKLGQLQGHHGNVGEIRRFSCYVPNERNNAAI